MGAVHPCAKFHYGKYMESARHFSATLTYGSAGFPALCDKVLLGIKDRDAAQQSTSATATSKPPPSIVKETWSHFPQT